MFAATLVHLLERNDYILAFGNTTPTPRGAIMDLTDICFAIGLDCMINLLAPYIAKENSTMVPLEHVASRVKAQYDWQASTETKRLGTRGVQ